MKRYKLLKLIATGGMGEVFLARSEGPHGFSKTLVVKRILSHLATDPQFVEMFLDEARLAALLTHPNIVQIYELGEEEGSWYLAMEYIHGRTLRAIRRELLRKRELLSSVFAARICSQALQGLHYAHTLTDEVGAPLHVVHRDVSPDNVLVGFNGQVKVVDFGIAKASNAISTTRSGTVKGKFSYMAPEQLMGQPLDGRTDVYAMGVVLFELLTGARPWSGPTEPALINSILHSPPPAPRERNPALPEAMNDLILRALQKDPAARFSSAEAMSLELERFIVQSGHQLTTSQVGTFLQELFGPEAAALPVTSGSNPSLPQAPVQVEPPRPSSPSDDPTAVLTTPVSTGARARVRALATAAAPDGAPQPSGTHPAAPVRLGSPEPEGARTLAKSGFPTPAPGAPPDLAELDIEVSAPPPDARSPRAPVRAILGLALLFAVALVGAYVAGRSESTSAGSPQHPASIVPAPAPSPVPEALPSPAGLAVEEAAGPADVVRAAGPADVSAQDDGHAALGSAVAAPSTTVADAAAAAAPIAPPNPAPREQRPRAERRRTSSREAAPVRGEGRVALRISPWAEVEHGGKSLGITPMPAVTVPAGKQTFTLRNTDLGVTRKVTVAVPLGGEVVLRADLFE